MELLSSGFWFGVGFMLAFVAIMAFVGIFVLLGFYQSYRKEKRKKPEGARRTDNEGV